MLKVSQSVFKSWPVLAPEAKGKFKVKELVVVEILKMLPEVPVEILVIILFKLMLEEERLWLPSVTTRELGVKVASLILPAMSKAVAEAVPATSRLKLGLAMPMPTLPFAVTAK